MKFKKSLYAIFALPLFAFCPTRDLGPVRHIISPFKEEEVYQKAAALTEEQIAEDVLAHRSLLMTLPSDRGLKFLIQLRLLLNTSYSTKLRTLAFLICHPMEILDPNPRFEVFYGAKDLFLVFNIKNILNQEEKQVYLKIYSDHFFSWLGSLIEHDKVNRPDMVAFRTKTILDRMAQFANLIANQALNGMAIDWAPLKTDGYAILGVNEGVLQEFFSPQKG